MNLVLHRKYKLKDYTIGQLYRIDRKGKEIYICDILEDTVRNKATTALNAFIKIFGKTAIPYGKYRIVRSYSNRFKKVLPELLKVPHYEGVRIHSGNTAEDTEGCLLPGKNTVKGRVTDSRKHFATVDTIIADALLTEEVWITITD